MEKDAADRPDVQSLVEALGGVPDPRSRQGLRHPLGAILGLAVCAMLCGARSVNAIAQWGRDHGTPMAHALGFTRDRTPCGSTLHEVFVVLDRQAFEEHLSRWLQSCGLEVGEAIAIDGKTLRGIHGEEVPGVHLVAAYAHQSGIVVGQQAVGVKQNELGAVPGLLAHLGLQGRVVTGDAQFTQREVCRQVTEKGGPTFLR